MDEALDHAEIAAADRRENRTALIVAGIAFLVIALAALIAVASSPTSPGVASPSPSATAMAVVEVVPGSPAQRVELAE